MFLHIRNISKSYQLKDQQSLQVLENINLEVNEREFISLLVPSVCRKSTLLSIIAGLAKPTSGLVKLENELITEPGPCKSMVFQEPTLFP